MVIRTPKDLGHLIRDNRTRNGMTQAELASRVGVSRKWIIDLERGKPTAVLSLAFRTLRVLGLEVDAKSQSEKRAIRDGDIDAVVDAARSAKR